MGVYSLGERVRAARLAGNADAALNLPTPPARADRPEPVVDEPVAAEAVVVDADGGGDDAEAMERIRQDRLRRWQRQER